MDINRFKNIIKEIKDNFVSSQNIIEDAIKKELEYGHIISFDDMLEEINRAEASIIKNEENRKSEQRIAIFYNGMPEVMINSIIVSIYYNDKVTFYSESYDVLEIVIINLINNILDDFSIKNKFIIVKENLLENLIYNHKDFDQIIYIGDYFEYENIKFYINENITYNPYGFIKVYMDKMKFKEEYKELTKSSYKRNISVEYYEDVQDFIQNVKDVDDVIIYETEEKKKKILENINPKTVYTHEEFINNYKFNYL